MNRRDDYLRHRHHDFRSASRQALADDHLQAILHQLSETLDSRSRAAWQALPESDALRDLARSIKAETLANLDQHLATLAASVRRRGGHVHWAADADEACRIVTDILRRNGARRVVKSKSMTTEEIGLNRAMEAAGVEVTETDLGEYIVQLAGHRPSHIVGPAIHLTTEQVAEIFSSEAGARLPADPEQLTAFARRQLRDRFARADAGITGANFAVAESGSVVVVENEGNARLTTTLPPIHIAVMGMEKVIPRLADLPVFLKVLARAATGQTMSVYTSLISGPRGEDELDGPRQFHLVILDNGRSDLLASELAEGLFCIRCGACLNACPVYGKVGGHAYGGVYSGPIGAVLTPPMEGMNEHADLPQASSLCGACQEACPVRINIPRLLLALRARSHERFAWRQLGESVLFRMWAWVLRRPWRYRAATWLASRLMGGRTSPDAWLRRLPGPLAGWTSSRDFPAPARKTFRSWWVEQDRDEKDKSE